MRLTPTDRDRLLIFTAAELARARKARGLQLNVPEATALIADTVCEAARDGLRLMQAAARGASVLTAADVAAVGPGTWTKWKADLLGALHFRTLGTLDDRRILFEQLTGLRCPSTVRQASDGGGLYTFVEPRVVVTIHVTDLQAERSDGAPTLAPLLSFDARGWHGHGLAPCPRPLHPVFDRVRPDKDGSGLDVRVAQVGPWLSSAPAQVAVALPVSTLVRRAVWTKTTKGQTAVRKLVVWKTNKADQDATFPAYVVHWTDYSAGRATPLDREVRVAPTETEALRLAEALVAEHIKKGWEPVGA